MLTVPEAYTSQTCHRCGVRRQPVTRRFSCQNYGLVCDADVNSAWNIVERVYGSFYSQVLVMPLI
jgi:transposase